MPYLRKDLRQDAIHFLLGMTIALAVLGVIATISGTLASLLLFVIPGGISDRLQDKFGSLLRVNLVLAAILQAIGWSWLPRIGFIPRRLGQRISIVMGAIAVLMFLVVLVTL